MIVGAVETHAAGEVEQRLLLGQALQHVDRGLQRGELTVGVEDVELGVVLSEGGPLRMIGNAVIVLVVAVNQDADDLAQLFLVVGKVILHRYGAVLERHDRDQIRSRHLRVDELERIGVSADRIGRRHVRPIEVEHDQPLVLIADVARGRR